MKVTVTRWHDFSYGHTVYGHESKCAHLHGHNGRVYFTLEGPELDRVGRVIDFGEINRILCLWVESVWDHKFLVYNADPRAKSLEKIDPDGVVLVTFNPTAENIALHIIQISEKLLDSTGVKLIECKFEETRKCSATVAVRE